MKVAEKALKLTSLLLILFFILLFLVALFGNRATHKKSPLIGKKAPDLDVQLFDGTSIKLSDFRDKIVLLNFWASWCLPCKQEAPEIDSSWIKYKNTDVVFLGINILDEESNARRYLSEYKPDYLNGIDKNGSIALDYGVAGVPETYFIDTNGIIKEKYTGPLSEKIIDAFINKIKSNNS